MRFQSGGVERQRIDRRYAVRKTEARDGRVDAKTRKSRWLDRRHCPAGERREILATQIEIVLAGELGVRQRVVFEQCAQIERGGRRAPTSAVLQRIGVDDTVVSESAGWSSQCCYDEQIGRHPLHLHRAGVAAAQWEQRIGIRQSRERQRLCLERHIVGEILVAPRHATIAGHVRDRLIAIVMQ